MITRRNFLSTALGGAAASVALHDAFASGRPAWTKPIGLELYTVRDMMAKDPAKTLKDVAAAGYTEVEITGFLPSQASAAAMKKNLSEAKLTAPSGYYGMPKTADDWKKSAEAAHSLGLKYMVTGNTDEMGADGWKKLAALFNECGKISAAAGAQFCYHNHIREFENHGNTTGYQILLAECDPKLVKMEMDIFWIYYSNEEPLHFWKEHPGRFPLLHIKDIKKGVAGSTTKFPDEKGPNPFAAVGKGKIDWAKIFAHVREAGAEHIFVEQDRCDVPELESIKESYEYLRKLKVD
ncbi:MAG: sugar phosphate isomerase/epimerase family protein [Deltaproteobacteria bacterium]